MLEADLLEGHRLFVASDDLSLLAADLAGTPLLPLLFGVFVDKVAVLVVGRLHVADFFVALAAEFLLTREIFARLGTPFLAARIHRVTDLALGNLRLFGLFGGLFILFFLLFLFSVEFLRLPRRFSSLLGKLSFIFGIQQ